MRTPFKFRSLFLSKDLYFNSWIQYKRSLLTGQVLMLSFCIGLFYSILNVFKGINENLWVYISLAVFSILLFLINRKGKQIIAGSFILILAFVLVFYFSSVESTLTGAYLFYLVNCLGAFALLGFENRKIAIAYCILTLLAFRFSYIDIFNLFDVSMFTDEYVKINFMVNFTSSLILTILIVYFLMNLNYISEEALKKNELKLKEQNEMLIKANAELDRFVYSTSHDLKAPLSSILGLINISEKVEAKEELAKYFEMMRGRISTMEQFIKDITDYSRNSRLEITIEPIILFDLVKEIFSYHAFSDDMQEFHPQINISPNLMVHTDKERLKIILNNLINNAIKYRKSGKETLISLSAKIEGNDLIITVDDNGLGIDPAHIDKIFNMFYRASEKSKGSGLGLYIVKETVDKLGGKVSVSSTIGKGTSFTIQIPSKVQ